MAHRPQTRNTVSQQFTGTISPVEYDEWLRGKRRQQIRISCRKKKKYCDNTSFCVTERDGSVSRLFQDIEPI